MTLVEFIQQCLDQNYRSIVRCLEGLTPDELSWRPNAHCMSIGFIAWHYSRVLDMWIQFRSKAVPQLWEEGWADRMGRSPAEPLDVGYAFTEDQLAEFEVAPLQLLLDYAEEAKDKAMQFLKDLEDDALDKTVITTMRGEINLTTLFQQLLWEFNQHGGQMAYLRGMLRGIEDSAYTGGVLP